MNFRQLAGAIGRFGGILSMLFTGAMASAGMSFVAQFLLTRSLPVVDFGRLAALLVVINFLTPLGAAGVNYFLLRAYGREGHGASRWVRPCAILAASGTAFACVILLAYGTRWADADAGSRTTVLVTCVPILLGQIVVELAAVRFQLEGRYSRLSLWQCVTQAGRFAVAIFAVTSLASLPVVLLGYAVVGLLSVGLGVSLMVGLWQGGITLEGHADRQVASGGHPSLLLAASNVGPFALMTMFYVMYFQGPVVILEWLRGGVLAGVYNSAFLIIAAISLIPTVIYMRLLLPKICRWAVHDRALFNAAFQVGVPAMAVVGFICMAFVIATASWLLPLLFGPSYADGVTALTILALSIPVRFVQTVYSSLFVSERDMLRKSGYLGYSALVGLGASLLLVPYAGLIGAAIATVAAETALLILHVVGTSRFILGVTVVETLRVATFRSALTYLLRTQTEA